MLLQVPGLESVRGILRVVCGMNYTGIATLFRERPQKVQSEEICPGKVDG